MYNKPYKHNNSSTVFISTEERFWANVNKDAPNGCWEWLGGADKRGYGRFGKKNKTYLAHRIAYEIEHGSFPKEMNVLHRCDNPRCVNPSHLFLGTQKDNITDMVRKRREAHNYFMRGERIHTSKLSADDVVAIRRAREKGELLQSLATKYGVTKGTIHGIVIRRLWKHVP